MVGGKERKNNLFRPEVFVIRKGKQEKRREYWAQYGRPLFGSDILFDPEGKIAYPTWHQVKKGQIEPAGYSLLSKKRARASIYLAQDLTTKTLYELRINEVTKDGGSVEAAIRSVEHVLAIALEREKPQMKMVRNRVGELFDLFADFSAITDEQLEKAQKETYRKLGQVGFDPARVVLEEKRRIAYWLPKASRGQDSLGRRNWLITTMALQAAHRRAVEREQGIGETVSKFVRMREALRFEREFCREILQEVGNWLIPERMPAHYLFKFPEKPPTNVGYVKGILNTCCWQLTQPHVKPYRPAGREAGEILKEVVILLGVNKRGEIVEKDLFGQARNTIQSVLKKYQDIY